MKRDARAFTLVELMVVVAIITVLVGIVWVVLGPAREQARRVPCTSNLHQIGQAIAMYRSDYDGIDAVQGTPMHAAQLGLPDASGLWVLWTQYIKDRGVLFCPDYVPNPLSPKPDRAGSSYAWVFLGDGPPIPERQRFSYVVGQRGDEAVMVYCASHNNRSEAELMRQPPWKTKREVVLRLSGQIESKTVPVRTFCESW